MGFMLNVNRSTRLECATKGIPQPVQEGIMHLLPPKNLLSAYYIGRARHNTGDIVLVVSADDPENITPFPRSAYVRDALKNDMARQAPIAKESAHQVAKFPTVSDLSAFWLVFEVRGYPMPIMCVLYETLYETGDDVEAPSIAS